MTGVHVSDGNGGWHNIGHLDENHWWDADLPEDGIESFQTAPLRLEPITLHARIPSVTTEQAAAWFGVDMGRDHRAAITARTVAHVPTLPPAPCKRRGLTGKAYRIARRAHRRAWQAWVRAGAPTRPVERLTILPNVHVRDVEPVPGTPNAHSIGCELVADPS